MKKLLIYGFLFICSVIETSSLPVFTDEMTVCDEIDRIVEQTVMDCVRLLYNAVKVEVDKVKLIDNDLSLYERVMPLFVTEKMKKIVKVGTAHVAPARLYEMAAAMAYQLNDIESMTVLYIQAEQVRNVWYLRAVFMSGCGLGAASLSLYYVAKDFIVRKFGT